jgi:hypothetical protein
MFKFTFETVFVNKAELRAELADLLWKIDHTWPMGWYESKIGDVKAGVDESHLKRNGGMKKWSVESNKIKAQKVEVWRWVDGSTWKKE